MTVAKRCWRRCRCSSRVGQRPAGDPQVLDGKGAAAAVGSGRVQGLVVHRRPSCRHRNQDGDGGAAGQPAQDAAGLLDVAQRLQQRPQRRRDVGAEGLLELTVQLAVPADRAAVGGRGAARSGLAAPAADQRGAWWQVGHGGQSGQLGDAAAVLELTPTWSLQCVGTSPPYFGLRDYGGQSGQLGREATPDLYVAGCYARTGRCG